MSLYAIKKRTILEEVPVLYTNWGGPTTIGGESYRDGDLEKQGTAGAWKGSGRKAGPVSA